MLEFLKGKDPTELAKQNVSQAKQPNKKKGNKKTKEEAEILSQNSPLLDVPEEGFSVITIKKPKQKTVESQDKKKEHQDKKPQKKTKAFFKDDESEKDKEKKGGKRPKRERNQNQLEEGVTTEEGEQKKKPQTSEPREYKEKIPREDRKQNKPPREKRERKERPEGEEQPKPRRLYPTSAPNIKYDEADLNDILNAITQDYNAKPKPQTHRIASVFSKIPRNIVVSILSKLEARDLIALSEVNYYFSAIARTKETLWKDLLLKDFGIRDIGKYRGHRAAYRAEFKKKKQQRKKKDLAAIPQDELKDSDKPQVKDKKKPENEKPIETPAKEETEDQE